VKRLREVLRRLPALIDRGAFDAACHELRRVVPLDLLSVARASDDGTHFCAYVVWTSADVGVPSIGWAERADLTRAQVEAIFASTGGARLCKETLESPSPLERIYGEAGVHCTLSVPIGRPLAGVVGFGFAHATRVREAHTPLLRQLAIILRNRLDRSLLAAHAARLRTITQAMPMGAIMLSRTGAVEQLNPAAMRLLGRPARELVGRSIRELCTAPDGGPLGWRIDQAAGPAPGLLQTPGGPRAALFQLAAPTPAVEGEPYLYGPLFVVDTSAEIAAAAALERRTRELQALERDHRRLIDDLPVVVFATDGSGRCTYVSGAVERLLGYTPEEVYAMGSSFGVLNLDEVPDNFMSVPRVVERDFRQRRKDGREVVMRYSVRIVADNLGKVLGMQGCGVDVTAERDVQQQLMLADRLAALGMLVAGIGHEINNPAAYVGLGVQQIARHLRAARGGHEEPRAVIERVLPILDDVAAGVNRIAEIVGELKLFSRHPASEGAAPIDLNGLVRSAASLVQSELRTRARLSLDLGELPPVPGAWTRLSQVVLNLLINAAQSIAPGAAETNEVSVLSRRVDNEVQIVVHDTGCGIRADEQSRIFDPFYTTKPVGEGSGLGLSISYDIVRRLGGTMTVDSEPGRGSRFTVTLPWRPVEGAEARGTRSGREAAGSVLIVDDERPLASAIARELSARMEVELVHSGGEALQALSRGRFDAVLCDLRMPDLSGADVYLRTRARDVRQADRFVFLTGASGAPDEVEFLRASGRPVLEKPFAMSELWRAVGAVVSAEPT
jgi:PAS domain S-box-containing protein